MLRVWRDRWLCHRLLHTRGCDACGKNQHAYASIRVVPHFERRRQDILLDCERSRCVGSAAFDSAVCRRWYRSPSSRPARPTGHLLGCKNTRSNYHWSSHPHRNRIRSEFLARMLRYVGAANITAISNDVTSCIPACNLYR